MRIERYFIESFAPVDPCACPDCDADSADDYSFCRACHDARCTDATARCGDDDSADEVSRG